MGQTPEPSQSPLDKAMFDGRHEKTLPNTSAYCETQVATPAASSITIQSSSDQAKSGGEAITTPRKTPLSRNTESNTRLSAPYLLATSSPTSSRDAPVLPSSYDIFVNMDVTVPYALAQYPRTYTYQFPTSNIRTQIARRCEICITGCEFKTCSQRACDNCIENGHGSSADVSLFRARILEEHIQFPFPRLENAKSGNPTSGNAAIDDETDATISNESNATISIDDYR